MNDILTRAATFAPATFNAADNTVDVVFSTGAGVLRFDAEGQYLEMLDMSPGAVDLSQLIGGPVLDSHNRGGVNAVLGVVESAATDGARGLARLKLTARADAAGTIGDVKDGILRNVSAGYTVQTWQASKRADGMRTKTATRWTPKEISFTAIGADAGATVRSKETMETQTIEQIRSIATAVGVAAEFAEGLVNRNASVDEARAEIVREAARNMPQINGRTPEAVITRETSPDDMIRAQADALYCRVNAAHVPSEQARPYVGRRMADFARETLRFRGLNAMGSDAEIVTRALHTTSDFPNLLSNLTNKILAASYQLAPSGLKVVCKQATATDFKPRNILRRGELPTLLQVNEAGEFKRGTIDEGKESYSIGTYGRVFGISRQAIINDSLGAFTDLAAGYGMAAREFENGFLCDLLTDNSGGGPKLADTNNLFHSTHGNLAGSGAVISDTTLTAARLALRTMKGLDGLTPISATPKYLVVPAALETTAEKYLATIFPTGASSVNAFSGSMTLVVDARLDNKSATRWYVFADPAVLPVIEVAYLSGYEGLQIESRAGFEVDGIEMRARLDFGAGGIDSRGAYMNPGA